MKVSIALITCRRPHSLARLLASFEALETSADVELVVVDNDPAHSARSVTENYNGRFPLIAVQEPIQGIPYARNAALRACSADTDFIAFLDDDEVVTPRWLTHLLQAIETTKADAVGGPVDPLYPEGAPQWAITGKYFARENWPNHQPRPVLITNNCLIRAASLRRDNLWFDTRLQFTGSSDTLFFKTAHRKGWQLGWASDALVYEHVPPQRLTSAWIVQRQYRIGNGLALCDILLMGRARALPLRLAKAAAYLAKGCAWLPFSPLKGRAALARSLGTLSALWGYRYEEYRPDRLVSETP